MIGWLAERLSAGEIDFAASTLPVHDEFEWQAVRHEPMMALLSAKQAAGRGKSINLKDLEPMPFILFESGFAISRLVVDACRAAGFEPKVSTRSSQLDFVVKLVAAEMGIAFLPKTVAEQQRSAGLRSLLLTNPSIDWNIAMTWRREAYLSHAAKAWLALVREHSGGAATCA
ncbi:DNA-binding transcriptional LysR family regulator [Bradyrhizobium sp. USDA 4518]